MALHRRDVLLATAGALTSAALGCTKEEAAPVPAKAARPVREVGSIVAAQTSVDGAGVKLRRALGGRALAMLDPFLLLDEIKSDDPNDYAAGFPKHPHRGFETVTYMIDGAMEHQDSVGNHGHLGPGSAQWMTAGHGIVHSEMPKQERGLMWGFQLWVNLPKRDKLIRPRYQDIAPDRIAEVARDRAKIRVIAGTAFDRTGPVTGIQVDPIFADVALEKGGSVLEALPPGHAAFLYVIDGALRVGDGRREVRQGQIAVLDGQGSLSLTCDAASGRALVLAGRPLGEPVSRSGPFVMNTDDEIKQAWDDYRAGRLTEGV
jgi:redox-sensitive bicupin YhaK (pirin superfamily)